MKYNFDTRSDIGCRRRSRCYKSKSIGIHSSVQFYSWPSYMYHGYTQRDVAHGSMIYRVGEFM